jgi:6-phosphogluconolactonase
MPSTKQIKPQICRWHPFENSGQLGQAAVDEIQRLARLAIDTRKSFTIVLSGGTTPRRVYEALRHIKTDWRFWHIYFGDERCLPIGDAERNSRMAAHAWLDHVEIPATQIHTIPAEKGADMASEEYALIVNKIAVFDLVLLGLGEDGHTASLFPNHELGDQPGAPAVLAVLDAPKPPPQRVSLSARRLSETRNVMFLVTGKSKIHAVTAWRSQKPIPASVIAPENGVDVYIENELIRMDPSAS